MRPGRGAAQRRPRPAAAAGLLGAACGASCRAAARPRAFAAAPAAGAAGAAPSRGAAPAAHRGPAQRPRAGGAGGAPRALAASGAAAALAAKGARRGRGAREAASEAAGGDLAEATEERGRVIRVTYEGTKLLEIPGGDVASMDAFMKENATTVCIQGVERIEDGPQDDPSVKYAFLEPNDVGPFKSQMRLLLQVEPKETQKVEIHILEMWSGNVDKKTGEVTYPPEGKIKFDTENTVTWEESAGGLKVINTSNAVSTNVLPWWFPVPDVIVQKVSQFFISKIISAGQTGVNTQIKEQYAAWRAK